MAIENVVFNRVLTALTPVVSVGVGSAICTVCSKRGLDPKELQTKDLPVIKAGLVEHWQKTWETKMDDIRTALSKA